MAAPRDALRAVRKQLVLARKFKHLIPDGLDGHRRGPLTDPLGFGSIIMAGRATVRVEGYGEHRHGEEARERCIGLHREAERLRDRIAETYDPYERGRIEGRVRELRAATADYRSITSLLEMLLLSHLRERGYLPKPEVSSVGAGAKARVAPSASEPGKGGGKSSTPRKPRAKPLAMSKEAQIRALRERDAD